MKKYAFKEITLGKYGKEAGFFTYMYHLNIMELHVSSLNYLTEN